jgi:Zn-dependent peptidase ImmA (M78 family)
MTFSHIEDQTQSILKVNNMFRPGFDIKKLVQKLSIKLIADIFVDDVSGYFVIKNGHPVISYDQMANSNRQRFTIAHELGHYILHSKSQPIFIDKTPKVFYRNSASASGEVLKEREANAFAAALLMPKALVLEELKHVNPDAVKAVEALALKFAVSIQAISFRLSNLGFDVGSNA